MNDSTYTEDFAEIMSCARERHLALQLLNAWDQQGLPEGFYPYGVKLAFNKNSGYVFLVNEEYQAVMMNGDKLDIHHSLPYSGDEGFLEDFADRLEELHPEDQEYLKQYMD
jgi:hypothetical protein